MISTRRDSSLIERVRSDWINYAKGEPVIVEVIGYTVYGWSTELGAFRIEHKYNCRPQVEAAYSTNRSSWFCRLELDFIQPRTTGDDYAITANGKTAHTANARDALWEAYELSDDQGGSPAAIHCGGMPVATVAAGTRTLQLDRSDSTHVVGVEFAHDARGREGFALLDASGNVAAFVHSRPSDAVCIALNELFSQSTPTSIEQARRVILEGV